MTDSIGFLGLGSMGGPIVARLAAWGRGAGHRILVHDIRADAMARAAEAGAEPVAGGARSTHWAAAMAWMPATLVLRARKEGS